MPHALKQFGPWLFCTCFLAGCISVSPSLPTSTPAMAMPTLRPTATPWPTEAAAATSTVASTDSAQSGNDAATFIKETYPDYSVLAPGEKFVKTWEIKNIGTITWNTNYFLALDATSQNDSLGSPAEVNFPKDTSPGATVTLAIPLAAPTTPGTYSVYWKLENDRGKTFGVDGDRMWVTIIVCVPGTPCSSPISNRGASANGVSASLTSFTSGGQSAVARFCMTFPNRNYGPGGGSVSLIVDQQSILASTGGSLEVGCFEFEFPVTAAQIERAKTVAVSIGQVRMIGGPSDPQGACETARLNLKAKYPGLDFQCDFRMAGYYTDLQLPAGMTRTQADVLIVDAIEGAIYGPWTLNIKK